LLSLRKTASQKYHDRCQRPQAFRRLSIVNMDDLDHDVKVVLPSSRAARQRLLNHETRHQVQAANSRVNIFTLSKQADLVTRDEPPCCSIDASRIGISRESGELLNPFWIKMGFIEVQMRKRGRLRRAHRIWREILRYSRLKREHISAPDETFWSFLQRTAEL
jgi:hypothetical protein